MQREGPPLELLLRRLRETPADFLAAPRCGSRGDVAVAAVVHDVLRQRGVEVAAAALDRFDGGAGGLPPRALALTLLLCWLLADPAFAAEPLPAADLLELLGDEAAGLATTLRAEQVVADAERGEELARTALARLGLRPAGESAAQAQDRLTSLSSRERARVLAAARAAEARARQIRAELARKAAQESADKWARE